MRDDSVVLYCVKCGDGYGSLGEIPPTCPSCLRLTTWTTFAPTGDTPRFPFELTDNDRAFMKRRGIRES